MDKNLFPMSEWPSTQPVDFIIILPNVQEEHYWHVDNSDLVDNALVRWKLIV